MKRHLLTSLLGIISLLGSSSTKAAQQQAEVKEPHAKVQLRERVELLYQEILKNDRVAALELVAPESKNQFLNNRYDGLAEFRIVSVAVAQSGNRATVRVSRIIRAAGFAQPLNFEADDTWQLTNDKWYLVLPPPGELDTPFGKIKFDSDSKPSDADALEMKQRLDRIYKNVDPDQYIQALQRLQKSKAAGDAKASDKPSQSGGPDSKADSKKPVPPATVPSQGDNQKPKQ